MISPEYFDIFGFVGFLILLATGLKIRKREKLAWIIVIISVLGIIADGYVILTQFVLN